ncbi:acetoacetate--CoA ligase [Modestobacter sp. SYSU DS0657]
MPSGGERVLRRPQLNDFSHHWAAVAGAPAGSPAELHRSTVGRYRDFWRLFLDWSELTWEGSAEVVCTDDDVEHARFFPDLRLNYAENLLRPLPGVDEDAPALTAVHGDGSRQNFSRTRLREVVQASATALTGLGVQPGDRVVLVAPNTASAVTTALAVAALGGAVSTGTPDMGPAALLGRFEQVEPTLLVLDRTGQEAWQGVPGDTLSALLEGLPTLRSVLVLDDGPLPESTRVTARLADLLPDEDEDSAPVPWPRLPFDHPLFVMFSSGTTGPPKAMVHGAGGSLLEHVKEHRLHVDLTPVDTLYFHTTTAWMMWNWQLSALAAGAHVVLYDGPLHGPETLWRLVAEEHVTVFGTSPAYLQLCQDAGYRPAAEEDLSRLRAVLSTGAVLHDWQFDWFADAVGPQPLQSISGGTDLIGCLVLGRPDLPIRRGRAQALSLGLDVVAVDPAGKQLIDQVGDLVCRNPFPSRPVCFLRDPDGTRRHQAYFAEHPGMWTQGDLVDIGTNGSTRLHGRSDGVLNIDGVRIGPSEIYAIVRQVPEVADALALEQEDPHTRGLSRLVLLVVLRPGAVLDERVERVIRTMLHDQASAAHVPSLVLAVPELPLTHNGKRSDRAARDAMAGRPAANLSSLRNPECLDAITRAAALARNRGGGIAMKPAAADDVEDPAAVVVRLWQQLLGVHPSAGGTFSELGGTSRQAMTLARRVRVEAGRDVGVDALLADPTGTEFIEVVCRTRPVTDSAGTVLLAPGEPGRPALFLVHDLWGDVDIYAAASQALTSTGPVHGIRAHLPDDGSTPPSVPALVASAVAEVTRLVPTGPLRLAGHSFGGLLALEAARTLRAAGREVEFVGLLDVLPPLAMLTPRQQRAKRWADRLATITPGLMNHTYRQLLQERLRPDDGPAEHRMFLAAAEVHGDHRVEPYSGPVTFFRAHRRIPVFQHVMGAWRAVLPDLRVVDVPGAHHDMLGLRHAEATARQVSVALDALDGPPRR